jgi:murein DD-endopeptidase MepM/ murein hydrolase activator NlpD
MKFQPKKDRKYPIKSFRSFLLLLVAALLWLFCANFVNSTRWKFKSNNTAAQGISRNDISGKQTSGSASDVATLVATSPLKKCLEFISYVVKPGDTFLSILSKYGLSSEQAIGCHRSLAGLGLFSLLPGDSIVLTHLTSGVFVGFELLHKLSYWYTITLDSLNELKASKRPVECSSQRCIARGELVTSLSESMNEMGVDDVCVSKFADIFAWDINFFVDPKKGDSYEIIFEKKFSEGRFVGYGDILAAEYVNNGHAFRAIGLKDEKGNMHYFDPDGKSMQKQFLKAPLHFNHISSGFSTHRMHPILGIVRPHLGVDYAAPAGTPVHASADGIVCFAGYNGGFGDIVKIRHGGAFETSYGHLRAFGSGIRVGKHVSQGDLIGFVGATGLATGPHLDYRMTRNRCFVNPSTISLPAGKSVAPEKTQEFQAMRNECLTLFSLRLPGKTGAYVLDVSGGKSSDSTLLCRGEKSFAPTIQ